MKRKEVNIMEVYEVYLMPITTSVFEFLKSITLVEILLFLLLIKQ